MASLSKVVPGFAKPPSMVDQLADLTIRQDCIADGYHLWEYEIVRSGRRFFPHCTDCDVSETTVPGVPAVLWYSMVVLPNWVTLVARWVAILAVLAYLVHFVGSFVVSNNPTEGPWSWAWVPQVLAVVGLNIVLNIAARVLWAASDRAISNRDWPANVPGTTASIPELHSATAKYRPAATASTSICVGDSSPPETSNSRVTSEGNAIATESASPSPGKSSDSSVFATSWNDASLMASATSSSEIGRPKCSLSSRSNLLVSIIGSAALCVVWCPQGR